MYGNERDVGLALKEYFSESGKTRNDILITSKVDKRGIYHNNMKSLHAHS